MSTINITSQPTDQANVEGKSVTLSITAEAQNDPITLEGEDGIISYQWEKKNKRTGLFVPIIGAISSTYTISSLHISDDTEYRCIVKNTYISKTPLRESLVKTSYGSESVLVDDEYSIGYRSFTVRTEPTDIYEVYPQAESVDISDINPGQLYSLKITDGGDGYLANTYSGVSLTGGSGSGATADIITESIPMRVLLKSQGSGYEDGFYADTPLMSDDAILGSGARADLLITDGKLRKVMTTNSGSSYVSGDLLLLEKSIQNISQANPAVVNCTNHGLTTGDSVYISRVGGMTEVNEGSFTITVINANSFSLDSENSTGYTAAVANTGFVSVIPQASGNNAVLEITSVEKLAVKSVTVVDEGEGYSVGDLLSASSGDIGGGAGFEIEVTSVKTTVTTSTDHGLKVNQIVGINDVLGMTEINELFGTIISVPTNDTMILNIDSSNFTAYTSGGYVQPQITTTITSGTVNPLYITAKPS